MSHVRAQALKGDNEPDQGAPRVMSDAAVIALAAATALGARAAVAVPLGVAVAAVVAVLAIRALRRPWFLVLGAALLASSVGARAWNGLAHPVTGPVAGRATLVSDPEPTDRGVRVDLRLDGRRYRAYAFGSAAGQLGLRAAGEMVDVRGVARRPQPDEVAWLAPRHIGAELAVESVGAWSPGGPTIRMANLLRRTLDRGAEVMSDEHRALFAGFVLGDDREQSPRVIDDFRASGLSHLLAVSGQNVAFVLAIASPALRRLTLGGRFVGTVAVIAFFALVTRFEPSVLRASAMAGVAALATTLGREASGMRLLGLAVAGLVLVDPMLVHSLGFGLSIAASTGILVAGSRLTRVLPGPRWFASAVGITCGAQIGVAPLLIPAFGGLPLVALPANLLAGPAAAPLVAWGMTAGVVAGSLQPLVGDAIPRLLHLPTDLLVGWIAGVARTAARLPLGELGLGQLLVTAGALSILLLRRSSSSASRRRHHRLVERARSPALAVVAVAALVGVAASAVRAAVWPAAVHAMAADGVEVWLDGRTGAAVVGLDGRARASPVLEGLRRLGVRHVALVVVTTTTTRRAFHETLNAVGDRYRPPLVVVPADAAAAITGATPVRADTLYQVGGLAMVVDVDEPDRLTLHALETDRAAGMPGLSLAGFGHIVAAARGPPTGGPSTAVRGQQHRHGGHQPGVRGLGVASRRDGSVRHGVRCPR